MDKYQVYRHFFIYWGTILVTTSTWLECDRRHIGVVAFTLLIPKIKSIFLKQLRQFVEQQQLHIPILKAGFNLPKQWIKP